MLPAVVAPLLTVTLPMYWQNAQVLVGKVDEPGTAAAPRLILAAAAVVPAVPPLAIGTGEFTVAIEPRPRFEREVDGEASPARFSLLSMSPPPEATMAAWTKAVVARRVELLPKVCVGAVGLPVRAGEARGAPRRAARAFAAVFAPVPPLFIGSSPVVAAACARAIAPQATVVAPASRL